VDAILASGRYAQNELLDLAVDHDPGFDQVRFAEALTAIDRLPDTLFQKPGGHLGPEGTDAGMGKKSQHRSLDQAPIKRAFESCGYGLQLYG
jgi:hypothetical protein